MSSNRLSDQVALLEDARDHYRSARDELIDDNATLQADLSALDEDRVRLQRERERLEAERDRLKADAISDLIKRHWLENQVRNREDERDDLQRQVQEARDHIAALRAGQGRWPRLGPATAPTVPRLITADELREGQTVTASVEAMFRKPDDWEVFEVEKDSSGTYLSNTTIDRHASRADQIVLLADAPQLAGYAGDDHQDAEITDWHEPTVELATAETIRASEPGSTWEDRDGYVWEWDKFSLLLHGNGDLIMRGYLEDVAAEYGPFTRSTSAPRGDYGPPRLTVHDLEVAPVGSRVIRRGARQTKGRHGLWRDFYSGVKNTGEELIAAGWGNATLTTPEATSA